MANNYAVVENSVVINVVLAEPDFAQAQGWIELVGDAGIGWKYIDGQFISPKPIHPTPEEIQAQNKAQAESLLKATDWTATMDVGNPQYRNPYLKNQNEFLTYRAQLCNIALNPPSTVVEWPTEPEENWGTS